jgi:hypothetical protein
MLSFWPTFWGCLISDLIYNYNVKRFDYGDRDGGANRAVKLSRQGLRLS